MVRSVVMITQLKPYLSYKDSGVEWLGKVPAHWGVQRLRNIARICFSNVDKLSKDNEFSVRLCNYSDVYHNDRIHFGMDFMKATATAEEIERFRLRVGDVLITKDSEAWDDIGVSAIVESAGYDLVCGYHLALLRPIVERTNGEFLHRALLCRGVASQFFVQANGVTRFGLSQPAIKSVWLPIAPLPEQTAIARFLDYATNQIECYIRAKKKLIALLGEQKQVMIHDAVTGKIDVCTGKPYPSYKPSGVEWLGEVPKHWEVSLLTTVASPRSIIGQQHKELLSVYLDRGVIRFSEADEKRTNVTSQDLSKYQAVDPGDFVLNNQQAWRGSVGVSSHSGIVSPAYLVLSLSSRLNPHFANFLFRERVMVDQYLVCSRGVGSIQRNLYWVHLKRVSLLLPPFPEQTAIVRYLDKRSFKIDKAIARTKREIELLSEYSKRLISDVVTGKLDVCEVVTRLPQKADKPALIDGSNDLTESEEEHSGIKSFMSELSS